ncbi:hypothetical protein MWU75_01365 [Ornithinimicrobium sp. F0845]|uniref:hypothetical protein n=1 Tax=Ornithinimicrobium sp. F0845 TaxID=2926412 RepID=UPI001FF361B9|nr:hypothetical protein [Ornithinimicrobium sp. F0845]MCK0110792.1 hypothetical protein [Ornithinimicrobium sp. F0845]
MISRTAAPQLAPRPRRLAAAGLALAAALTLSACQMSSPVTTDMGYDPADGVSVDAGAMAVRDLLVVSEGDGAPGVVSGQVVNNTGEAADVTISAVVDGQMVALQPTVTVEPGASVRLDGQGSGGAGTPVTVPNVPVRAGGVIELMVQTSQGEADSGLAPVVLPDGYYGDVVVPTTDTSQ